MPLAVKGIAVASPVVGTPPDSPLMVVVTYVLEPPLAKLPLGPVDGAVKVTGTPLISALLPLKTATERFGENTVLIWAESGNPTASLICAALADGSVVVFVKKKKVGTAFAGVGSLAVT